MCFGALRPIRVEDNQRRLAHRDSVASRVASRSPADLEGGRGIENQARYVPTIRRNSAIRAVPAGT